MKNNNYIGIVIGFIVIAFFIFNSFQIINRDYNDYTKDYSKSYILIKRESDNYLWNNIEKGIADNCEINNIAVQILNSDNTGLLSQKELFEMAVTGNSNGIIVSGYNSNEMEDQLRKAKDKEIPIVFINDDGTSELRDTYIGPNNYQIGQKSIQEISKKSNEIKNILVIDEYNSENRNLLIDGMISEINNNENINLTGIVSINTRFNFENNLRKELKLHPEINVIIGTGIYDGINIAKAIVNMNKVGEVYIIAYDNSEITIEYIQKGIIAATLFTDGYLVGEEAVNTLNSINEDKISLDVFYVPTTILNKYNLKAYLDGDSNE
ncbi:substrate-binding domain-containing protein [Clostridiaceae bacterium HSG29]|nr:substrate-binding domain-containing protein [Clostridiaceae bacterium HSG29]